MSYIGSHNFKIFPTHISQDWRKISDFQQAVKSIGLNLKDNEISFSALQREEIGVLDTLWAYIRNDKIHFQIDAFNATGTKTLFSLMLLDTSIKAHNLIMDNSQNIPAKHEFVGTFRSVVRIVKGQVLCSTLEQEGDAAMAKLLYTHDD